MKPSVRNLFKCIPETLPEEWVQVLAQTSQTRIERVVSQGHTSDPDFWYDQEEDEFVLLVSGQARLAFADESDEVTLDAGDWLIIPAHCRHRVAWTDPKVETVWLTVFMSSSAL